jgi:hypothetical protein
MAEIEFKAEGEGSDPIGQKVGVLAAVLAVALAVVSIASHRAHTMAVVEKSEANDQWSFYQSKRIKFHSLELGTDMVNLLGHDKPGSEQMLARYESEEKKYAMESKEVEEEAKKKEDETRHTEAQALRYDLGGRGDAGDRRGDGFAIFHCSEEAVSSGEPEFRHFGDRDGCVRNIDVSLRTTAPAHDN